MKKCSNHDIVVFSGGLCTSGALNAMFKEIDRSTELGMLATLCAEHVQNTLDSIVFAIVRVQLAHLFDIGRTAFFQARPRWSVVARLLLLIRMFAAALLFLLLLLQQSCQASKCNQREIEIEIKSLQMTRCLFRECSGERAALASWQK